MTQVSLVQNLCNPVIQLLEPELDLNQCKPLYLLLTFAQRLDELITAQNALRNHFIKFCKVWARPFIRIQNIKICTS